MMTRSGTELEMAAQTDVTTHASKLLTAPKLAFPPPTQELAALAASSAQIRWQLGRVLRAPIQR